MFSQGVSALLLWKSHVVLLYVPSVEKHEKMHVKNVHIIQGPSLDDHVCIVIQL